MHVGCILTWNFIIFIYFFYALFISFHIDPFEILEFPNTLSEYEQGLNTCTWYMGSFNCITRVLKRVNLFLRYLWTWGKKNAKFTRIVLRFWRHSKSGNVVKNVRWHSRWRENSDGFRLYIRYTTKKRVQPHFRCQTVFARNIHTTGKKRWKISLVQQKSLGNK